MKPAIPALRILARDDDTPPDAARNDSPLARAFYVVARSEELRGRKPLQRKLFGTSLALFRDRQGAVAALVDRCPHRNVSLSGGRVVDGTLECPYHGWRFDGGGACVQVPCAAKGAGLPHRGATPVAVREQDGLVWCALAGGGAAAPALPRRAGAFSRAFDVVTHIRAPFGLVLDNFIDAPHTGFVHKGLFRGAPSAEVRVVVEETPTGVRVQTFGEATPSTVAARLLGVAGTVVHIDELLLPSVVRVTYAFGARTVVTTSACTPEDDDTTRVTTRVLVDAGPASALLVPALRALTRAVLAQDVHILEDQAQNLRASGRHFTSTSVDLPTAWASRALRRFTVGTPPADPLRRAETRCAL